MAGVGEGSLYPPIDPEQQAWLEVGDGHLVYYEVSGTPSGIPALFLHGGPGSSSNPNQRRFFNPADYRIVLFDQRGCGRSTPLGNTRANTTSHLIADIERLRAVLGVDRWLLFGGSWGSTLALAYAQTNPDHVAGLILRGVFTATRDEVAWFASGLHRFLPEAWARFSAGHAYAPALIAHYRDEVERAERERAVEAAQRWAAWEDAVMAVGESSATANAPSGEDAILARARVQLHYLAHDCFLAPGALLAGVARIAHLPCIVVQGRRDLVCPPSTAYTLCGRWPSARLRIVEEGAHSAMHPAMTAALVEATQHMARVLASAHA
jgi:proline iminopeptidase